MRKNIKFSIVGLLVMILLMSGCQSHILDNNYSQMDEKKTSEKERTIVTFQTWNPADMGPDSPIHQIIEDFEGEYPNIDVQYEYVDSGNYRKYIEVYLTAGEGADIFAVQPGVYYKMFREYQQELTGYCQKGWGENWTSHFMEAALDYLMAEGEIYGVPLGITYAGTAWADCGMLEQYGLEVPDSYEKLLETSRILREQGQYPLAIGAKDNWLNIDTWMSMAADIDGDKLYGALDGEVSFEEPELIESFQMWQDCFNNGIFQDHALDMSIYNDVNDRFQKKRSIPLMLNGSWSLNMFTLADEETRKNFDREDAEYTIFPVDWNNDGEYRSLTSSVDVTLCLNKDSDVKDEAFLFMKYLVDEGQKLLVNNYLEYLPSIADMEYAPQNISENGQNCLNATIRFSEYSAGTRGIPYEELQIIIEEMLEELALGKVTPQEAARQIQMVSQQLERE